MTLEAAGTRSIIFSIKSYPCMPKAASSCGWPLVTSRPTKRLVSSNGLGRRQNDLGVFRDQGYHFQHQKLPLYAQSREPFHTGHCRPFRTNTQTALGSLKMTSEAAGTRPIIFSIKNYPCMPEAGSHSIQGMAGHSGQTCKQTSKFLFALLV